MRTKKGTEKPIEIFVALFIILAVALLMLQLFQNQLTDKQQELETFQRESEQQRLREEGRSYCHQACSTASSQGCSIRALASLCIQYASDRIREPHFLDLNMDGVQNMDMSTLVGIGVCEDAIPCHTMIDRCCGFEINAATCKDFLERHWASMNYDEGEIDCLVKNNVRRGSCTGPADTWFEQAGFAERADRC